MQSKLSQSNIRYNKAHSKLRLIQKQRKHSLNKAKAALRVAKAAERACKKSFQSNIAVKTPAAKLQADKRLRACLKKAMSASKKAQSEVRLFGVIVSKLRNQFTIVQKYKTSLTGGGKKPTKSSTGRSTKKRTVSRSTKKRTVSPSTKKRTVSRSTQKRKSTGRRTISRR